MSSKRILYYDCPFCNKKHLTREDLVIHITDNHEYDLPEDFTPLRYTFNYVNKKPIEYHGICTECKGETPWDEKVGRYKRQCGRKACHESYIKKFENNMVRVKGIKRISQTPEGQEMMLANRRISGKYKFKNGVEKTYTGSYEKNCLEFLDKVMNIDPDDIMSPGPIIMYKYNGADHPYITDFYYQPYNLIIEVKDGGSNPNTRDMPDTRARQKAKEEHIVKNTDYNYIRLTDNDLSQLLNVFMDLKMKMTNNKDERVIHINELMSLASAHPVVGLEDKNSVIIVNYLQNTVFSGDDINKGYGITKDYKLDKIITRNKDGILESVNGHELLKDKKYSLCMTTIDQPIIDIISDNIGKEVQEGFLFETIFNKKYYTMDQVYNECEEIPDYYSHLELLKEISSNYFKDNKNKCISCKEKSDDEYITWQTNLENGNMVMRSKLNNDIYLEFNPNNINADVYYKDGVKLLSSLK